jgi:hypothetical protein
MALDVGEPGTSFFGRESDLGALTAALEQTRAGRGRLVAVTGDAGIGKTRLVEELARRSALPSNRFFWGRCSEQAGAPSYWPWSRMLRAFAAAHGIDRLREDLGADAVLLAPLVPGLRRASQGGTATTVPPSARQDGESRFRMLEAVAGLLRRAAEQEPLVVVLEDVHWADEASLALLELVAQELDDSFLLLIVTYRDRERPRLPRPLLEAVRHGQRVALSGLDRDAVAAIVSQASATAPTSPLIDRLFEITSGNPFFLGEVLRTLAQDGRLESAVAGPLTLPDTVRESIRRHLDPLTEEDRDMLALAAVAGQEFEVAVLGRAAEVDATRVLERLHAAVDRGLVAEQWGGRFRFAHALVRETLYGDLLPARRIQLHARVGVALEELHGDAAPLGALASHFLHAAPLGTAEKAAAYATRAAESAMGLFAYHDALSAYEQALAAVGAGPLDRRLRLKLRLGAAYAARRAGQDLRARALLLESAQDARALGDAEALFQAAVGYYVLRPNVTESDPDTIPLLEEALRAAPPGDGPARATLEAFLGTARYSLEENPENDDASKAAIAMARRVGDPRVLATALVARQLVVVGPGSTRERLALADEALALAESSAPDIVHLARGARTQCFLELGDVAAAAAEVERMGRAAERLRQPGRHWQVTVRRAAIALLEGRFDDGARLAAAALEVRRTASDSLPLQVFVLQMFLARRDTGRHGGLEGSLRWMVDHCPEKRAWSCVLAVFYADLGRQAEARAIFERLAADGFARVRSYQNYPAALAWLARVCTFLRDVARARQLYPMLLPYADQNIVLGADSQACLGSTHRYLGLLAATTGDVDGAERHSLAAIAMNERMGARPVLACVQHEYARLLQHRDAPGDRAAARELLDAATGIANACGMSQLLAWIDYLGPVEREVAPVSVPAVAVAAAASAAAPAQGSTAPAVSGRGAAGPVAVLRRDGDVWEVGFAGETSRMKDAKGVALLAMLLEHPGREIHVLDLAAGAPGASASAAASGEVAADRGDAGPHLDPAARAAYRSRLEDLRDELEEAERFNDPDRAARARHELEFLTDELARGVGLGGRERRAASAAERARINATRTIGGAVKRIAELSPRLGEHLRATVRTGYLCVYAPDPTSAVHWEL